MARKRRSLEEKELLVNDFKSSGLSLKQWCNNNNISPSTMHKWIYPEKRINKSKPVKFVEVTDKTSLPVSNTVKSDDAVIIRHNSFEIVAAAKSDFLTLREVLKAVKSIDV